jgi:very-short-patch-repair endonuclease
MKHSYLGLAPSDLAIFLLIAVALSLLAALAAAVATGRLDIIRDLLRRLATLGQPQYRARSLLTGNEIEFFRRLRRALPQEYIFPQVALSALIEPRSRSEKHLRDFRRISQKRVDYAIYTSDLQLVAIVELDDRTHNRVADAERDAFVASAGIRTLRFESRNKPTVEQIRAAVFPAAPVENGARLEPSFAAR